MDSSPVIFDISSDDEPVFDEMKECDDGCDWLTELLANVDRGRDDSDEVVVVGEYNPPKSNSKSIKPVKVVDDNDCVVLDGDPDKPVAIANDDAEDGDDVLVIGQKGQIACRDYPHPRHLCHNFPFSSTPHESHCDLCHCYVCDSLAPCGYWGTGVSSIDHCHATDKQDIWKSQRESFRLAKDTPLPVPKLLGTVPATVPELSQVPSLLAPSSIPYNRLSTPTTMHTCSSTRLSRPSIISKGRNQQPGFIEARTGRMHSSVPRQILGVRNNFIRRDRGPNFGSFSQQFVPSNTAFKRSSIIRGPSMNQSLYGSSNKTNCPPMLQYTQITAPQAASRDKKTSGQQDLLPDVILESYTCQSSSQPNMASTLENTLQSRPEMYSQHIPLINDGQNIYQHGNQNQNVTDSGFSDFDSGLINNPSHSSWQSSAENIQLPGTGCNDDPSTVKHFISQYNGSDPVHYKDHNESWFSSLSGSVASEDCVPPDLNAFSELAAVDAGMLYFDFETCWNGLSHE